MDDLIGKVLAGEATAAETEKLDLWLKKGEPNRKYFDQVSTIFQRAASPTLELHFDADSAWKKVKGKLEKDHRSINPITPRPAKTISWSTFGVLKIAASILLVVAGGYLAYNLLLPAVEKKDFVTGLIMVQDTLPDGSRAFLNRKSELTFEYNPNAKTRSVRLSGEAYFEIKHEAEKPFVIQTDEVLIKDLGTSFNVNAYPASKTIEVIVEEGEVQIYTLTDPGMTLKAGEKGVYDKVLKAFSRIEKLDTNGLAYKTKVFSFNNTDMRSVIALLNSVYNADIILANEGLNNCRLTVNFSNDKLDTIVDVLAETMSLTVEKKDSKIVLSGIGCAPN